MCKDCNASTISRRGLIAGGLALSLTAPFAARALAEEAATAPVSREDALQRLVEGNARYVATQRSTGTTPWGV